MNEQKIGTLSTGLFPINNWDILKDETETYVHLVNHANTEKYTRKIVNKSFRFKNRIYPLPTKERNKITYYNGRKAQ